MYIEIKCFHFQKHVAKISLSNEWAGEVMTRHLTLNLAPRSILRPTLADTVELLELV